METPKHTPLPWYKTASSPDGYIYGADNKCIVEFGPTTAGHMDEERWANAEFVVRACNAHDDMLEICEKLLPLFTEKYAPFWRESGISPGQAMHLHSQLTAAIANATE